MAEMSSCNKPAVLSLDKKIEMSQKLLREALSAASNPVICCSGGKKSVVLLHLARQESPKIPRVLYVQTDSDFENVRSFMGKLNKLWQLDLVAETANPDVTGGIPSCCRTIVGKEIKRSAKKLGADRLIIGNTIEDAGAIRLEDIPCGISVHPILYFTDSDIFRYLEKYRLPKCSLYDQGYMKIGCQLCTLPPGNVTSHAGLEQEKMIKAKLKRLGYL